MFQWEWRGLVSQEILYRINKDDCLVIAGNVSARIGNNPARNTVWISRENISDIKGNDLIDLIL